MRIEAATRPGDPQRPNEDHVSMALPASGQGGALVLLDGVTPPTGDVGCQHSVVWFTARLGARLLELSTSLRESTLTECLAQAIGDTAEQHRSTCDLSHPRTPQATVVAARWDDATVEYLVLSDSVLLLESPGGVVAPVRDDRLDRLPRDRSVERLRNVEGGFFTAATDPAVASRAVTGHTDRSAVRALAALTDGASRWVDTFRLGQWEDALAVLRAEGAEALIDQVRAAESADPERVAFHRGKASDDATALFAQL